MSRHVIRAELVIVRSGIDMIFWGRVLRICNCNLFIRWIDSHKAIHLWFIRYIHFVMQIKQEIYNKDLSYICLSLCIHIRKYDTIGKLVGRHNERRAIFITKKPKFMFRWDEGKSKPYTAMAPSEPSVTNSWHLYSWITLNSYQQNCFMEHLIG